MDAFQSIVNELNNDLVLQIIPTVMIPLTAVSVLLTMVATFIAGLFGVTLKAEGPKKLLEVLLKPKILFSAAALNALIYGGMWSYDYVKNLPSFLYTIEAAQKINAKVSPLTYGDVLRRSVIESPANQIAPVKNLEIAWETKIPKGVFRAPSLSSSRLFAGSIDGNIYEIDDASGEIQRQFFVGTFVSPATTIYNGTLYSGEGTHHTHHARIYAFDLETGNLKSTYETKGHTEGSPVIAKQGDKAYMFAPAGSDGLHAIDLSTMKEAWKVNDGHIDSSVFVEDSMVFAGTGREKGNAERYKSYATAYDFETGKLLWKNELAASSWMSPVSWRNNICFVFGEVYFASGIGGVNCYNKKSGSPTKAFNLNKPVTGMPTVVGNDMFVTDDSGRVCSLNLVSNSINWCKEYASSGRNFASAVYDKYRGLLVYATKSKGLKILDPQSGSEVYSWPAEKDEKIKWGPHFAGAVITKDGYVLSDISGTIRKMIIK